MTATLFEPRLPDAERRQALYKGDLVMLTPRASSRALCDLAWELIEEAFAPIAPEKAQFELPVEKFVEIISALKPKFTHHPRAKQLMRELFEEVGCDPASTYFDVPRLRVVSSGGYLTTGMGYAYKAHRDTWYACPPSQINWWTPITRVDESCGLVFHPRYFDRPVPNNSEQFDAYRWNADGRKNAASYIGSDPRPHPHLQQDLELDRQVLIGERGSLVLFSAQHLHATIPNTSGRTRFSIDFRTVHRDDILNHVGASCCDSRATGTTLRDFLRSTDLERFPEDIVSAYESGSPSKDGVLIFEPTGA